MWSTVTVRIKAVTLTVGATFSRSQDLTRWELQLALSQVRQHLVAGFEEGQVKLRKVQFLQPQQQTGCKLPGIATQ